MLIKYGLKENTSLVNVDILANPGCNEKVRKQIALCLLKNLEAMRRQGVEIRDEWIKPENLSFKIPQKILDTLGIIRPERKNSSENQTRSPPSLNSKIINHKKNDSKSRNAVNDRSLRAGVSGSMNLQNMSYQDAS